MNEWEVGPGWNDRTSSEQGWMPRYFKHVEIQKYWKTIFFSFPFLENTLVSQLKLKPTISEDIVRRWLWTLTFDLNLCFYFK